MRRTSHPIAQPRTYDAGNLRKFAENKELHPQSSRSRPIGSTWIQTKVVTKTHVIKIVRQLWCRSRHTDPRKDAQAQVPHSHGATPVPRLTVSHKVLSSEDQNGIKNTSEDGDHRVVSHPVQNMYWIIVFFKSSKAKQGSEICESVHSKGVWEAT